MLAHYARDKKGIVFQLKRVPTTTTEEMRDYRLKVNSD